MVNEKVNLIRKHFNSTSLGLTKFSQEFFEVYNFTSAECMRRYMNKNEIGNKYRNEETNKPISKGQVKTFDVNLLDNYGILDSIGQEYTSYKLPPEFKRIGILSDIHFPFHSMEALIPAIKFLKDKEIDCLYLNGDIFDFYSISRHEKDPDLRDFKREVDMCRDFVQKLKDIFPNCLLVYKLGNHEDRYARSLQVNAEEFAQLHDLQFHVFFHLDRLGYQIVDTWRGCEIGDLLVIHGHEGFGTGGVNPSQSLFNKMYCNTLMGHVHRTTNTMRKTGFNKVINTYSVGCLTSLTPKYMPYNNHNHGFAYLEVNNGITKVENIIIKDGKIV